MKVKKVNYSKVIGLTLIAAGLAIWFLPFVLVAIGNMFGTTQPADMVVDNFGTAIITVGPALVLVGLLLLATKALMHVTQHRARP